MSSASEAENGKVFANFNHDSTSLAVSADEDLVIYNLDSVDETLVTIFKIRGKKTIFMEPILRTPLVAIVTEDNAWKVKVFDFRNCVEVCDFSYPSPVLAVKVNRDRIVVCVENIIYVHIVATLMVLQRIQSSSGLIALSPDTQNCFLAYPAHKAGELHIYDVKNLKYITKIPAHENKLVAVAFSATGKEVATASQRGTLIRIFSSLDGIQLFQLTRGISRCVQIMSLSFSTCSKYLISSSNTETVHIFRLQQPEPVTDASKPDGVFRYLSKAVSSYLPTQKSHTYTHLRSFVTISLPEQGVRRMCAIISVENQLRILVALQNGYLYVYGLPVNWETQCVLIKKHDLRIYEHLRIQNLGALGYSVLLPPPKQKSAKTPQQQLQQEQQQEPLEKPHRKLELQRQQQPRQQLQHQQLQQQPQQRAEQQPQQRAEQQPQQQPRQRTFSFAEIIYNRNPDTSKQPFYNTNFNAKDQSGHNRFNIENTFNRNSRSDNEKHSANRPFLYDYNCKNSKSNSEISKCELEDLINEIATITMNVKVDKSQQQPAAVEATETEKSDNPDSDSVIVTNEPTKEKEKPKLPIFQD